MNFVRPRNCAGNISISTQIDMFWPTARYRSDNNYSSSLHCRVIKIQHQTEQLCLSIDISYSRHTYYKSICTKYTKKKKCCLQKTRTNMTRTDCQQFKEHLQLQQNYTTTEMKWAYTWKGKGERAIVSIYDDDITADIWGHNAIDKVISGSDQYSAWNAIFLLLGLQPSVPVRRLSFAASSQWSLRNIPTVQNYTVIEERYDSIVRSAEYSQSKSLRIYNNFVKYSPIFKLSRHCEHLMMTMQCIMMTSLVQCEMSPVISAIKLQ